MGFSKQMHEAGGAEQAEAGGLAGAADSIKAGAGNRIHFIRKVYLTMSSALGVGLVAGVAGYMSMGLVAAVAPILYVMCLVGLIGMIFMRRNQTMNKAFLYGWSTFQGLVLGGLVYPSLVASGQGEVFWMALGTTIAIFGSLTAYVFATRKDFSFMGGFLHTMCWGMFFSVIFSSFMGMNLATSLMYNVLGVVMITGFILYDTSNVLLHYDDDEYVAAALELVVDFFYLLWRLIALFSDRD